jgi:hypothetical protein
MKLFVLILMLALAIPAIASVELMNFSAVCISPDSVVIHWATASETNNDHFVLSRDFNSIATIPGQGNSSVAHSYVRIDTPTPGSDHSYTLTAVDINDSVQYLDTVWVQTSVSLISFTVERSTEGALLQWETAWENNLYRFEILRSGEVIYIVAAENTATGHAYSWTDTQIYADSTYVYTLVAVDLIGSRTELQSVTSEPLDAGEPGVPLPLTTILLPNYPNPFNAQTVIPFTLARAGDVSLTVYDVQGRIAGVLLDRVLPAGRHEVSFRAQSLPSGIYFAQLKAQDVTRMQKLVLIK